MGRGGYGPRSPRAAVAGERRGGVGEEGYTLGPGRRRQAPETRGVRALHVRRVVSRLDDAAGRPVAHWYWLTNLSDNVPDAQWARWDDYRWRIESYFKLLKEAGHPRARWEPETGQAVLKRRLIAGQACVRVGRRMRAEGELAEHTRSFRVRRSGRQMKRTRPVTAPARLDGLYKRFAMLETLHRYSLDDREEFADFAFPRKSSPGAGFV